jgi:hypothetical protein
MSGKNKNRPRKKPNSIKITVLNDESKESIKNNMINLLLAEGAIISKMNNLSQELILNEKINSFLNFSKMSILFKNNSSSKVHLRINKKIPVDYSYLWSLLYYPQETLLKDVTISNIEIVQDGLEIMDNCDYLIDVEKDKNIITMGFKIIRNDSEFDIIFENERYKFNPGTEIEFKKLYRIIISYHDDKLILCISQF